ncbi:MAG: aspartate aminotransferase family protein [Cyanobacteria bacterium REEB65]|nr:aspartate aminotransferase family protein [Cyanobacteria bacterium REEB65]
MALTCPEGIQIVTEIPGPLSRQLLERRGAAVPRGVAHATPIAIRRGAGALVEDVDGNWFVDLAGGIGVMNAGYGIPDILDAARSQAQAFTHSAFQVMTHEPYVALAEALNRLTPGSFAKKTLLVNSGAEAVENAVKIARAATKRQAVIAFEHGFHGRTLFALDLTSKVFYKRGFGPFAPEVYRVPYPLCFQCPWGRTFPDCDAACGDHLEMVFETGVDAQNVAAVILEPVLGEGGFAAPPRRFFERLRATCDRHGILLIADEIQTGIGRTGRMYACEHFGLEPDLILSAKSLAAGFPLAAVTGRQEVMDAAHPGGLGTTFGGNAVACAAALQTLDHVTANKLCERALEIGDKVRAFFEALRPRCPAYMDIRGLGGMVGVAFYRKSSAGTLDPATADVAALQRFACENGVVTVTAGTHSNVLRMLMPLVITDLQLEQALAVLSHGIQHAFGPASS